MITGAGFANGSSRRLLQGSPTSIRKVRSTMQALIIPSRVEKSPAPRNAESTRGTVSLTRRAADLELRTNELENSNLQRWFLTGAGVVVGGIL